MKASLPSRSSCPSVKKSSFHPNPMHPISLWFEQKPAKDAKDYTTRKQLFLRELRVLLLKNPHYPPIPARPISPWFEQKPAKDAKDDTTRKQLFLRELRVLLLKILISGGPRIATIQPVH